MPGQPATRIALLSFASDSLGAPSGQVDASKAGEQLLKIQQDKAAVLEEAAAQRGQISGLETQLQALQVCTLAAFPYAFPLHARIEEITKPRGLRSKKQGPPYARS